MARTPSTMLALGTPAPAFCLPDFEGRMHAIGDFAAAPAMLVVFACEHCPFVRHIRPEFARDQTDCGAAGRLCISHGT